MANDDGYGVPFGEPLLVEPLGVLENDTLDGDPAGENGATAELVSDVSHGTLVLSSDGSFTYTPGVSFDGLDAFTYQAVFGEITSQATVTLTACTGGPLLFACWREAAYLAKAAELGFSNFRELHESFEDDSVWGSARSPDTAPSVTSLGVEWRTNHPGPPALNEITTGSGAAQTGQWGVYDPDHGWATGSPAGCDIDVPPPECLYHDGFTGTRRAGLWALHGVGGFITGFIGATISTRKRTRGMAWRVSYPMTTCGFWMSASARATARFWLRKTMIRT